MMEGPWESKYSVPNIPPSKGFCLSSSRILHGFRHPRRLPELRGSGYSECPTCEHQFPLFNLNERCTNPNIQFQTRFSRSMFLPKMLQPQHLSFVYVLTAIQDSESRVRFTRAKASTSLFRFSFNSLPSQALCQSFASHSRYLRL
jgi:hypothetical protein